MKRIAAFALIFLLAGCNFLPGLRDKIRGQIDSTVTGVADTVQDVGEQIDKTKKSVDKKIEDVQNAVKEVKEAAKELDEAISAVKKVTGDNEETGTSTK